MESLFERADFIERMVQEYRNVHYKIQRLAGAIASAVQGTLVSKKVGRNTYHDHQIWKDGKRKRRYVRVKQVEELRREIDCRQHQERMLKKLKRYLEQLRKCLRHFLQKAETVIEGGEAEFREALLEERKKEGDRMAAAQRPYGSGYRYRTLRGEYVRSKSEMLIADLLYALGVPYEYEPRIVLGGREVMGDFWVKSRLNGKEYYWEHYGMLDKEEYAERAAEKQREYWKAGYRLGKSLIETYEDGSGLDMQEIQNMLRVYRII